MTGYRIPGPTCATRSGAIDSGTLCRSLSPAPGPVGSQGSGEGIDRTSPADRARLQEIRRLVTANNRSTLDNDLIICQIYMESRFDAMAKAPGSSAKGLMQMTLAAVKQVYQTRKEKELKHKIRDKAEFEACMAEGKAMHSSALIFDEATNIQLGTEYMQYCVDSAGSVEDGYKQYRGLRNGVYYAKISLAATRLRARPDSMQPLYDTLK
ncbi:transglycosylase SLT domain-containing protein [Pseudomonas mangiferae]|uniref:Lytic transglycosylase domain-containing protein n=1 Tax=Pseudomonas mangiferae TaxID=2593654 RepID=A0A553GWV7_9PSED|nr:transglycosylase SLT domain-containing protein [Pseudomonas mangiferae]TRX73986.1 lytic transglycosylase domain-containing protein [Pseudomonas mangiferae]